jgi:galactose mutarotase-like enzyme
MNNFITLENSEIYLLVDINYGGKIISLKNKVNNVEWVWFNSSKYNNFSPIEYSNYDSQWLGGYEELFPNDKVEYLNDKEAPDHGELWSSKWQVVNKTSTKLQIECTGYFSNSKIVKKFELINNKLIVKYEINNIEFDYYLFKLHLAFPTNKKKVEFEFESYEKVDNQFGNIVGKESLNSFLTSIKPNQDSNDFVYFYGVEGKVKIFDESDNVCILDYDKETLPYFWIFQSRGGWNNLNVNVLEPCNSGLKEIKNAVEKNLIYTPKENSFKTWYTIELV